MQDNPIPGVLRCAYSGQALPLIALITSLWDFCVCWQASRSQSGARCGGWHVERRFLDVVPSQLRFGERAMTARNAPRRSSQRLAKLVPY